MADYEGQQGAPQLPSLAPSVVSYPGRRGAQAWRGHGRDRDGAGGRSGASAGRGAEGAGGRVCSSSRPQRRSPAGSPAVFDPSACSSRRHQLRQPQTSQAANLVPVAVTLAGPLIRAPRDLQGGLLGAEPGMGQVERGWGVYSDCCHPARRCRELPATGTGVGACENEREQGCETEAGGCGDTGGKRVCAGGVVTPAKGSVWGSAQPREFSERPP